MPSYVTVLRSAMYIKGYKNLRKRIRKGMQKVHIPYKNKFGY